MKRPRNRASDARLDTRGTRLTGTPAVLAAIPGASWIQLATIVTFAAILGVDVFRLGFFADDFHFLDVARRVPLLDLLSGQYGVYPWYRPLSREIYFALVAGMGPFDLATAHLLSVACVAGSAWFIRKLGLALAGPRVAAIAPLLFLVYSIAKFLAGWPSGFQDLLALLLMLIAVQARVEGRFSRALAFAFLATFAKESAVVVFPLLVAHLLMFPQERRHRAGWLALGGTLAAATGLHLVVRAAWHGGGSEAHAERMLPELAAALARVVGGFVGGAPVLEPPATMLAAVAALVAAVSLRLSGESGSPSKPARGAARDDTSPGRVITFLAVGSALGLAPLVVGQVLGLLPPYEYYAFSAAPWLAILLAMAIAQLPGPVGNMAMVALVAWNTLALGYRAPDLSSTDAWRFRRWDWREAVRLSAVSQRLTEDIRSGLPAYPESLVVLICDLPRGCYFQTEDGPATRESLRDKTVRSYWLNAPAYPLTGGRIQVMGFDHRSHHLEPVSLASGTQGGLAATAVAVGNAPAAWAFASIGDSTVRAGFDLSYFRSAAALIAEGALGARREFARLGVADTTGPGPQRWAEQVVGAGSPLYRPLMETLRRPLDASAHVQLADAFHALGATLSEAVELRFATALDPHRTRERLRLARALLALGLDGAARGEFVTVVTSARGSLESAVAQRSLEELRQVRARGETESPLSEFEPSQ